MELLCKVSVLNISSRDQFIYIQTNIDNKLETGSSQDIIKPGLERKKEESKQDIANDLHTWINEYGRLFILLRYQ